MTLLGVLFVILLLVAMLCFAWVVGPLFLDRDRRRTPSSAARRRLPRRDWQSALTHKEEMLMLSWAITFLIIAIIAGVLGFGGIAGTATGIAKILFIIFLILFVASFLFGRFRGPR
jgi:uncharacterized membrane protein YtjA (UPF0391 family)